MNDFQTSNLFSLSVVFFLIIDRNYDYTIGLYGKRSPELHEEVSQLPYP